MSMDAMLNAMREEMGQAEEKLIKSIRERTATLRGQAWINSQEIAGPAQKEARDSTEYFHMGLSKKILDAATRGMTPAQAMPVAMNITSVLANRVNIEMLDQLLLVAYLRGVQKALELTGQEIVTDSQPETTADQGGQPETTGEVCPHCGEVHGSENDAELPPSLAEALREFVSLSKTLGLGIDGNPFAAMTEHGAPARGK